MTDDVIAFVRAGLANDIDMARQTGNMLVTRGVSELGVDRDAAERQARGGVEAAEAARQLFEDTVYPYLGTAGPTGRIAERQLRIMACMFADHAGFQPEWRP
ncbi:DUF6221 family protein [Streptomyces chartreusis]|uniref:DUF6221 family protein n=1 Tax=Streptomyces chartreusis TaxID=1969 RepID=UPI0037F7256B